MAAGTGLNSHRCGVRQMQPRDETELKAVTRANMIARRERLLRQAAAGMGEHWLWLIVVLEAGVLAVVANMGGTSALPLAFLMVAAHLGYIERRLNAIGALLSEQTAIEEKSHGSV